MLQIKMQQKKAQSFALYAQRTAFEGCSHTRGVRILSYYSS